MPPPLLTLGSFSFEGLESPDRIILKNKQRLVVHHLGSGKLMVDSLGEDSQIVTFRGVFSGLNAPIRIRAVEYMRVQGLPVLLIWDSQTLAVLIREFELTYLSSQWVSYRISCLVVQSLDPQSDAGQDPMFASPAVQVNDLSGLLIGTAVSPTTAELVSLTELATLDYDSPPLDSIGQAQTLLDLIAASFVIVSEMPPNPMSGSVVTYLANTTGSFGQCSLLKLAENRLLGIMVQAEAVSQS
jgi:hypothetical protein